MTEGDATPGGEPGPGGASQAQSTLEATRGPASGEQGGGRHRHRLSLIAFRSSATICSARAATSSTSSCSAWR